MTTMLVLTNVPDQAIAERMARHLVDTQLAACVNILAPCRSVYRWQGAVEDASEIPLMIKSTKERYPALEKAIKAIHPYDVPEIIAVPVATGWPAYLEWVNEQTRDG